jgi:uncharacterized protein YecE (DUF72 family)
MERGRSTVSNDASSSSTPPPSGTIRVGVAGWDYPDWNGIVYPVGAARGFDRLAYVARFVDLVEINSTFYRPVAPRVAESWLRRTADRPAFAFAAKAHRSCTHRPDSDPRQAVVDTLAGLAPLRDAGRLTALLLQFPQSFHFAPEALERLERLRDALDGWPLSVEVRHVSWAADEATEWFDDRALGWCAVDQPRAGRSTLGLLDRVTAPLAYLRLHGRNAADWFRPDVGRDARYDYLYSGSQLRRLAEAARRMAQTAEQLVVVQNNHFRGQALANALQMKSLLQGGRPAAPEGLVAVYPDLEADVRVERTRLF